MSTSADGAGWIAETSRRPVRFLLLFWGLPVALTLVSAGSNVVTTTGLLAGAVSGVMIVASPASTLLVLPFLALLSPLVGYIAIPGGRLLMSDMVFVLLAIQGAVLATRTRFRQPSLSRVPAVALLAVAFFLSSGLGLLSGTLVSAKPLVYLAQLVIVFSYTTAFADTDEHAARMLESWMAAIFLGAALLIRAYLSGTPLAGFEYEADARIASIGNPLDLFRATYYYTGFHFLLGISIVMLILRILFTPSARDWVPAIAVLSVTTVALLLTVTKTAIAGVPIAVLLVLGLVWKERSGQVKRALIRMIIFGILSYAFISVTFLRSLGDVQSALWSGRTSSLGSFDSRLEIYAQAISVWMSHPTTIVTGLGPDFIDRSGSPLLTRPFKVMQGTGTEEGTIDSGWLSFLLEMGVVGFAVLLTVFYRSIAGTLARLRQVSDEQLRTSPALQALGGLCFLAVTMTTQMLGYSKITWFPLQLISVGLLYVRRVVAQHRQAN